ncbi:LCP family protein [Streptomyces sp. NPDC093248]|uniref:LCP family protein n=1 Tax=Streptomyces sp. NPDC093248 TaxID=3155072 RepID=UPI003418CE13
MTVNTAQPTGPEQEGPATTAPPAGRAGPGTDTIARFSGRPSSRYTPRRAHARQAKRKRRKARRCLLALLVTAVTAVGGTCGWAEAELNRDVDLNAYGHRPPPGEGTNYLVVGSDNRDGLSSEEVENLHAGGGGGRRTDSMMILHTGAHGATMVSLPRDSWVALPGRLDPSTGKTLRTARDKLNAAFSYGGPELLVNTVERNTGLRIDHYAEIGFGGFVHIVDAVGGVPMCLSRDVRDEKSGADLHKGCQTLSGSQSLAFVRERHQEARGDLDRTQNQQRFLSALAHRAARRDTLLDPSAMYPAARAGLDSLVVDDGMHLPELARLFRAMRTVAGGRVRHMNVPVAGIGVPTSKGNVVTWDRKKSRRLFAELRGDRPVTGPDPT